MLQVDLPSQNSSHQNGGHAVQGGANIAVKLHPYKVCSTKIHKESNSACTMRVVEKRNVTFFQIVERKKCDCVRLLQHKRQIFEKLWE